MCKPCHGRDWYKKNKHKVLENKQEWYVENREATIDKAKKWNKDNKIKAAKSLKKWIDKTDYYNERYHNDIQYRLVTILRNRLRGALKNNYKSGKTVDLLGMSIPKFKEHIEKQWKPGMDWENHSLNGWHIDHIKPLANFDLSNPDELKKAAHYTNMQPLWAYDNLSKGDK